VRQSRGPGEHSSSMPKRGYLVEKGEKTRLLRDVSLSSKIIETLLHVRAVGNALKFNSGRSRKSPDSSCP
jgi:predicted Zn-dependent protease